jgi:putative hemolysin
MVSPVLEISIVLTLILVNGLLSMSESAFVFSRKTRLQQQFNEGDKRSILTLEMVSEPGNLLATIHVGITITGILIGVVGGAVISRYLGFWLSSIPAIAPFVVTISHLILVVLVILLALVFGEQVPKRIGQVNPERTASLIARPVYIVELIFSPLIRLLNLCASLVLRLIGVKEQDTPPVTEEEVMVMIEQGTQAGVFDEAEQDMLEGIFRLGDLRVETLITPRTEIDWLDIESDPREHLAIILESGHTRYPVARSSLDNVIGVVQAKDLLAAYLTHDQVEIKDFIRQALFVPENMLALKVLELIKNTPLPMALVNDEYGGLQGLVTVNDILEAVVGNVSVLGDTDEPEIVYREDGSWLLDGMLTIDQVAEVLNVENFPGEKEGYFQTLGGFVMTFLGHIPSVAESFTWDVFQFEVLEMDGLRVERVLVTPILIEKEQPLH